MITLWYFVDINECLSNPCVNGAECINTPGGYTCNCKEGWTGLNCANGQSHSTLVYLPLCDPSGLSSSHFNFLIFKFDKIT